MLDNKLLKSINSGRCFLLVGAGPSCEIGYPSWKSLAEKLYDKIKSSNLVSDSTSYEKYLADKKYPEFFHLAESDLGSRIKLVNTLITLLTSPKKDTTGYIYNKLSQWPFACYLTTNYDNEIKKHLDRTRIHYGILRNQKEDFRVIRDGVTNYIFKLHSDLEYPNEVVITSKDYQHLYIDDEGQYYRDKLRQIFEMFDVLIIGHILSDPDIDYILQTARKTARPQHPIYMIAADYTKAEEIEFLEKYNIVLFPYSNTDGKHTTLRRILSTYDRFIISRKRNLPATEVEMSDDSNMALSLFLFRKLQGADISNNISSLVLFTIYASNNTWLSIDELVTKSPLSTLRKNDLVNTLDYELKSLARASLVEKVNDKYRLTHQGIERVEVCHTNRESESSRAYGQFSIDLKKSFENLTEEEGDICRKLAEETIANTFKERSLTIAKKVFAGQSSSSSDLADIFSRITSCASAIENIELRLALVV